MHTEDVTYFDGATTLKGFLACDDSIDETRPGILLVPEVFGLGNHVLERTKMIASLGYVGFAVDLYGDRTYVDDLSSAMALAQPLLADTDMFRARIHSGLSVLASSARVDRNRLGAIGYCIGGLAVLELARDGADLAGVVSFHGNLKTDRPAKPGAIKASILVCHGADDPIITPDQVLDFEEEMRKSKADWHLVSYGSALHSFTDPAAESVGHPAVGYNRLADTRSWTAMQSFFDELFV